MPANGEQYRSAAPSVTANPFEDDARHISGYTAQEIATLQSRLDKQLGPEYISQRPGAGGGKVHYLAAEKVINLANEVFGFNGWSSQIQNVQIDFVDDVNGRISLGLSIITRVTLRDGMYHEDIGYGHIENCKGKAAAFEKAKKEAATDALKRALRNFGNVLGNCLYDKDYLSKVTKMKVQPSKWTEDNLHRHADFAQPAKREIVSNGISSDVDMNGSHDSKSKSGRDSPPHAEFEDEFGDNIFDGVEVQDSKAEDAAPSDAEHNGTASSRNPQTRSRMSSSREANGQPQQNLPPGATKRQLRPLPPQQNQQHPRPQQDFQNNQPRPQSIRSTTASEAAIPQPQPENHPVHVPDEAVGFVTGRAADMVSNGLPNPTLAMGVPAFNPKAESPSIRRTPGVDQHSSKPTLRQNLQPNPPPIMNLNPASNSSNQNLPPMRPPSRAPTPNFVNPSADLNRRIGMPPGAGSPHALNRTAYKPPSAVAGVKRNLASVTAAETNAGQPPRSPLRDVSNVAGVMHGDGADRRREESKKVKTTDRASGGDDGQISKGSVVEAPDA